MSSNTLLYLIGREIGIKFETFDTDFTQRFLFQKFVYLVLQTRHFTFLDPGLYGIKLDGIYSRHLNEIGYSMQKNSNIHETKFSEKGMDKFVDAIDSLPCFVIDMITEFKLNDNIDEEAMRKLNNFCTIFFTYKNLKHVENQEERYNIAKKLLHFDKEITDKEFDTYYLIAKLFYNDNEEYYKYIYRYRGS